jgi:hypothetical protein
MTREENYHKLFNHSEKLAIALDNGYTNVYKTYHKYQYFSKWYGNIAKDGHLGIIKLSRVDDKYVLIRLLTDAIEQNHTLCAKYLLSKPFSHDISDPYVLDTWFLNACSKSNVGLIKILRSRWPQTNIDLALSNAIETNKFKMVRYLLSLGANLINPDPDLNISLSAVESGNLSLLKYLLQHGLMMDRKNENIFLEAAGTGNLKLVKFLVDTFDFKTSDHALRVALYYNHIDIAEYLLKLGLTITRNYIKLVDVDRSNYSNKSWVFILSHGNFQPSELTDVLNKVLAHRLYETVDILIAYGANLMDINREYLKIGPLVKIVFLLTREPRLASLVNDRVLKLLQDNGHTDLVDLVLRSRKQHSIDITLEN